MSKNDGNSSKGNHKQRHSLDRIDQYNPEVTKAVLAGDERYAGGVDELRVAIYANSYRKEQGNEKGERRNG